MFQSCAFTELRHEVLGTLIIAGREACLRFPLRWCGLNFAGGSFFGAGINGVNAER